MDWSRQAQEAPATDPGWVLHHGERDGFEGWLYHFADGVTVTEEGQVVELSAAQTQVETLAEPATHDLPEEPVEDDASPAEPEHDAGPPVEPEAYAPPDPAFAAEPVAEPEVEYDAEPAREAHTPPEAQDEDQGEAADETEPEARVEPEVERAAEPEPEAPTRRESQDGPEAEPEAQVEHDAEPEPEEHTPPEPAPATEALPKPEIGHAAGLEAGTQPEHAFATAPVVEADDAQLELDLDTAPVAASAVAEPEVKPDAESEPGAEDKETAAADEAEEPEAEGQTGPTSRAQPGDEDDAEPEDQPDQAEHAPDAEVETQPEDQPEPENQPEPEDQPEPGDQSEGQPEPRDDAADGTPAEPTAAPGAETAGQTAPREPEVDLEPKPDQEEEADFPSFVAYSPSHVPLYALAAVFVVSSVISVLMIFLAVQDGTTNSLLRAGAVLVIALAAAWLMLGWEPTVVSVRDGVLEMNNGSRSQKADLRDPDVVADSSGKPASPAWKLTVKRPEAKPIVVRGSQVRRRQFARIVAWHQAHPHQHVEEA